MQDYKKMWFELTEKISDGGTLHLRILTRREETVRSSSRDTIFELEGKPELDYDCQDHHLMTTYCITGKGKVFHIENMGSKFGDREFTGAPFGEVYSIDLGDFKYTSHDAENMGEEELEAGWIPHFGSYRPENSEVQIPIFGWTYVCGPLAGGDLHAYPDTGLLVFQTRRGDYPEPGFSGNLQKILKEIDTFKWGKPSHIDEIYGHITKASEIKKNQGIGKFLAYCEELSNKWERIVEQ